MWYCKYLTYTFIKQYIFPEVWPMYLMLYLIASYLWIKFSIPAFPKNDNGILNPWIKTCTHWQTGRLQIPKTKVYGDTQLTVNGRKWPQFQLHLGNQVLWQRRIWLADVLSADALQLQRTKYFLRCWSWAEFRSCVKVEVAVLGFPS